jgi:hypothetical protein
VSSRANYCRAGLPLEEAAKCRAGTIDQALDFVVFREELARGFTAVRRSVGVNDVIEGLRRA